MSFDTPDGPPSPPPLVLLANDQEWTSRSLESLLGPRGFATVRAYTGRQALEMLRTTVPDVVVLSVSLPDIPGPDLCRALRESPSLAPGTPLVLLTAGTPTRADRLDAYRAGAWELLSEPFDVEALLLKLDLFVRARREAQRAMDVGLTDPATGVYNLRGLVRRARELGADMARRHEPVSCLAFIVSPVGGLSDDPAADFDEASAHRLAESCRGSVRASDVIARIGRTELVLVAPGTDETGATRIAERVRAALEATPAKVGDEVRALRLRAAMVSVADYSTSATDLVSLVLRAAQDLRASRQTPSGLSAVAVPAGAA